MEDTFINDVKMKFMKNSPKVIESRVIQILDKFDNKKNIRKIIEDRNSLTHKLYYGKTFDHFLRPVNNSKKKNEAEFKNWLISWRKEVVGRSRITDEFTHIVFDINHELAKRVINYKDSHGKK